MIDGPNTKRLQALLAAGPLELRVNGTRASKYSYLTYHQVSGRVPAGIQWTDRTADLAKVHTTLWSPGYPNDVKGLYGFVQLDSLVRLQLYTVLRSPADTDLYLTPGVPWTTGTFHILDAQSNAVGTQYTDPTEYQAGHTYADGWLKGPFGPSLSVRGADGNPQVARTGNDLSVNLPMFSDAAGHRSEWMPSKDTGSTVLTQDDGTPISADGPTPDRGPPPGYPGGGPSHAAARQGRRRALRPGRHLRLARRARARPAPGRAVRPALRRHRLRGRPARPGRGAGHVPRRRPPALRSYLHQLVVSAGRRRGPVCGLRQTRPLVREGPSRSGWVEGPGRLPQTEGDEAVAAPTHVRSPSGEAEGLQGPCAGEDGSYGARFSPIRIPVDEPSADTP
ncbi:hypothetical protein OH809_35765 [Streptomyces sp. NBC_00873]|uniref:hypothetical protein n=1 Tax=unclassified Streptomyces TaxID=2593676 RepID=UPI003868A48C|nr:hypothetical protein OH809_35765 [Streptomyces sp. NBC_00873]WTA42545.1 hypothetical protein OH821_07945 [Streptomyces sp. NBC_00842]